MSLTLFSTVARRSSVRLTVWTLVHALTIDEEEGWTAADTDSTIGTVLTAFQRTVYEDKTRII